MPTPEEIFAYSLACKVVTSGGFTIKLYDYAFYTGKKTTAGALIFEVKTEVYLTDFDDLYTIGTRIFFKDDSSSNGPTRVTADDCR